MQKLTYEKDGALWFKSTKFGDDKDRVVPLAPETVDALRLWEVKREALDVNGYQRFFCSIRDLGSPLTTGSVRGMMQLRAKKAGIERKCTPHVLRHTYATRLLDEGFNLREVQELLGHANVNTTEIYLHVNPSELRAKIQAGNGKRDELLGRIAALEAGVEAFDRKLEEYQASRDELKKQVQFLRQEVCDAEANS